MSAKERRFPAKGTCFAIYSRVVNTGASLADVLDSTFPWCREWEADLRMLFAAYVEAKQKQSVLDYDDLLLYWSHMAAEPAIAADLSARFDHVLVDEYQDTNRLQASILLALKPDGRGLTVVGDDAQSIYSFRGATVRNILDFPAHFNPPARQITLERNYRSTGPILAASNAVIEARQRALHEESVDRQSVGTAPASGDGRRRGGSGALYRRTGARSARAGHEAQVAGGAVSRRASQRRARDRTDPAQHSIREVRWPEVSRLGARQGCARRAALGGESARPCRWLSRRAIAAGHWPRHRCEGAG